MSEWATMPLRAALAIRGAAVGPLRRSLIRLTRRTPVPPTWPAPAGRHPVGVRDAVISGLGPAPTDGVIRIWYPAVAGTGADPRPYFGGPEEQRTMVRGLRSTLSRRGVRALGARRTASRPDASPSAEDAPVVVFSHGFTGFVGQNTHLCEHLASAGYVVVSVAYPGAAAAIAAPGGSERVMTATERRRLTSPEFVRTIAALLSARTTTEEDAALARAATVDVLTAENARWTRHLSGVLDALIPPESRARRVDEVTARLLDAADWSRLALAGMSFGGSTSANLAQVDPRVSAAINLDGLQQGELLRLRDSRVPMLVMSSAGSRLRSGRVVTDLHYEAPGSRAEVRRILVPDARHYAFTDLVGFGTGAVRRLLDLGTVDASRMLRLVADTTLAFLDATLRPVAAAGAGREDRR
ncbi:MAG: dienelactone hydrolase family protein [Microbacterium sp.]|jgi:dienelactone hydrolase|uniref:alpha/beta hydrolase n=1 Tax=Microbacterium sp. TaxID=51671 RepID=UPI0028180B96|nr:dienelactone hydrolase family protein [Microbacterium sp.]MDR2322830.1 dienelactone hydrolase family protein [Microbacterium sp.]